MNMSSPIPPKPCLASAATLTAKRPLCACWSWKQRPVEKGLILIAASFEQLKPYIDDSRLSDSQREAIFSCWPGPVTFVFPARPETPRWLTGRFDSLAVRVTNHPLVIELCEAYGKPLVSTSANLTGQPPCRTPQRSMLSLVTASRWWMALRADGKTHLKSVMP